MEIKLQKPIAVWGDSIEAGATTKQWLVRLFSGHTVVTAPALALTSATYSGARFEICQRTTRYHGDLHVALLDLVAASEGNATNAEVLDLLAQFQGCD